MIVKDQKTGKIELKSDFQIGDLVSYQRKDTENYKASGYYPPIGTIGEIIDIYSDNPFIYTIKWAPGTTKSDGKWNASSKDIIKVPNFNGWLYSFDDKGCAIAKYRFCNKEIENMIEACEFIYCPYCGNKIKIGKENIQNG